MRKMITLLLPLMSVTVLLIAAETTTRFYHLLRWNISFLNGQPLSPEQLSGKPITLDSKLGWRATERYRFEGVKRSADGSEYSARVSQDGNGFRMFGDPASKRTKLFVIGDSFTQAVEASDDRTYFAVVKKLMNLEVFAYGGGGFGTLQELMVLDRYLDVINPDLILWQYSTNDIINNSPDLELDSSINNNGMLRPYWVNGENVYILPKRDARGLRLASLTYCRVCYMVFNRIDILRAAYMHTVETQTSRDEPEHERFLEALQTTEEIMGKVKRRVGKTAIAAFIVGTGEPYGSEYEVGLKDISRRHGILMLQSVETAVLDAESRGVMVRADDGAHWNEVGHRLAGVAIADELKNILSLRPLLSSTQEPAPVLTRK